MQWISYLLTRLVIELFRFIPFRALYVLSDGLAFLLHRVIGYRKQVVYENLTRSFPEKPRAEIAEIARKSYRNLTDITLETIKSYTLGIREIDRRAPLCNPELVNHYLDQGQSIILAGSHYGNWEYSGITMPSGFHGDTVTAYKAITNRFMDRYVNLTRTRTGMIMVSMDGTFPAIRQRQREGRPTVYILLSDQSPSSRKSAHWVNFLGQDTASLPGVDVLARKFRLPVIYYHVRRLKRGFYEIEFFEICSNPAEMAEAEITARYTRFLENIIRTQPENWLWSHKRWKMKREGPADQA